MALNFNASPYFDDYQEFKDFVRVLFRPGFAIQAREVTQLQTILQNQITRVGDYNFEEGSRVYGGETSVDVDFFYVKLDSCERTASYLNSLIQSKVVIATGNQSGVKASVKYALPPDESDPYTIYVKYESSGDGSDKFFRDSEDLLIAAYGTDAYSIEEFPQPIESFEGTVKTEDATGRGSAAFITEGIRYLLGFFIRVESQLVILDKYNNSPTKNVGVRIKESIVTPNDDPTLLDNALGSPNEAAPGAHRYRIRLELDATDNPDEEDFIEIISLKDGKIEQDNRGTDLAQSGIESDLAQRTYDQSGNFIADQFVIDIDNDPNDSAKLKAELDNGRAYISGYEVTTTGKEKLSIDKGRDTDSLNNTLSSVDYDSYVVLDLGPSGTNSGTTDYIDEVKSLDKMKITSGGTTYATARPRAIGYNASGYIIVYLFDITEESNKSISDLTNSDTVKLEQNQQNPNFSVEILDQNGSYIVGRGSNVPISVFPVNLVSSISDISYSVRTNLAGTEDATQSDGDAYNRITFTAPGQFDAYREENHVIYWNDTNAGEYKYLSIENPGLNIESDPFSNNLIINDSDGNEGSTGVLPYNADDVYIHATIRKSSSQLPKQKIHTDFTDELKTSTKIINLGVYDAIDFTVKNPNDTDSQGNPKDVSNRYKLDNGQRDGYYGEAILELKSGQEIPNSGNDVLVSVDYYEHTGSSDYFTVNSYPDEDYDIIPTFVSSSGEEFDLRSCVDFRPTIDINKDNFTGTAASFRDMVAPGTRISADVSYYLPRIDKIAADEKGNFSVITGSPANEPVPPEDPKTGISLFEIRVPAYTFSPGSVEVEYIEHEQFTMRDVGKLENRVENIEYFTSLNILEKDTANRKIADSNTGLDRFKNGFLVDNFTGHGKGGVEKDEYNCSIDTAEGKLRPPFKVRNVDLQENASEGSNYKVTGDLVTLPYTEESVIEQLFASRSESVNPNAIYSWEGEISLDPESDTWIEDSVHPRIITNRDGQFDNIVKGNDNVNGIGGIWNFWQDFWAGRPASVRNQFTQGVRTVNVPRTVRRTVNERAISISAIPLMRSRKINFTATRMKPNSRVYPFFDGVDVSDYCKDNEGNSQLITDENGNLEGTFTIPSPTDNDSPQFRTGERVFRLIDNQDNNEKAEDSLTIAEGTYSAVGALSTRDRTIVSVRRPRARWNRTGQGRRLAKDSLSGNAIGRTKWSDPLAQSFLIEEEGGVFLTGIDLFFAKKDQNIPVTVHIREMENGKPTQKIVPFSEVTLNPDQVNVSDDGSVATKFDFWSPAYLQESTEYCFVVFSNSNTYHVYIGRIGEQDIQNTGVKISKQPYAGVLFKSQNASTWTAEQGEDLKFRMNKAKFDTTGGELVLENNKVDFDELPNSPIIVESSNVSATSTSLIVKHPNHGLSGGISKTEIKDFTGGDIGPISMDDDINGEHNVQEVIDRDRYIISINKGTDDGTINSGEYGGNKVKALPDVEYNVMQPIVSKFDIPGVSTKFYAWTYFAELKSGGTSISPYEKDVFREVDVGDNIHFAKPRIIASETNEEAQTSISGNSTFKLKTKLESTNSNISPVIDLSRSSVIAVNNRISGPLEVDNEDTNPNVKGTVAKYLTKDISLDDSAEGIRVIANIHRRQEADVDVYIRYISTNKNESLGSKDWIELTDDVYPGPNSSIDESSEYEFKYEVSNDTDGYNFDVFEIKVVMYTDNPSNVPVVQDFRAIALGT